MKNFFLLALFATISMLFSCSNDDNGTPPVLDDASYTGTLKVGDFEKATTVDVDINEENSTLTLVINDAQFATGMPLTIDITVKNLGYIANDGVITFEAFNVEPYMNTETEPSSAYMFAIIQGTINSSDDSFRLYAKMADGLALYLAGKEFEFEGVK